MEEDLDFHIPDPFGEGDYEIKYLDEDECAEFSVQTIGE